MHDICVFVLLSASSCQPTPSALRVWMRVPVSVCYGVRLHVSMPDLVAILYTHIPRGRPAPDGRAGWRQARHLHLYAVLSLSVSEHVPRPCTHTQEKVNIYAPTRRRRKRWRDRAILSRHMPHTSVFTCVCLCVCEYECRAHMMSRCIGRPHI